MVGSGIAGALLALGAAESGPVVVVTEGTLGDGSTRRAQGGIAAAVDRGDSVEAHLRDTLEAGAGLCDPEAAAAICREGPAQVTELLSRGVVFDRSRGRLRLAREGAHSAARVVHAGGDATGAHIVAALSAALRADPASSWPRASGRSEVLVRDGRAAGLRTRGGDGRSRERPRAPSRSPPAGWAGSTPAPPTPRGRRRTGPPWRPGPAPRSPTSSWCSSTPPRWRSATGPLALVSEAVRGEGAVLRDARGRRFMPDVHPMAELGPRDVVARAIARRAAELGGEVTLDLRHLDAEEVRAPLPDGGGPLRRARPRPGARPDPGHPGGPLRHRRRPGRHGRPLDPPGLLAVGECAATGAHGANRLASNGLLEAAVLAAGAADALAGDLGEWPEGPTARARTAPAQAGGGAEARAALQAAMWRGVRRGARRRGHRGRRAGAGRPPRGHRRRHRQPPAGRASRGRGRRPPHREPRRPLPPRPPAPRPGSGAAASPGSAEPPSTCPSTPRPAAPGPGHGGRMTTTAPACALPSRASRSPSSASAPGRRATRWARAP